MRDESRKVRPVTQEHSSHLYHINKHPESHASGDVHDNCCEYISGSSCAALTDAGHLSPENITQWRQIT